MNLYDSIFRRKSCRKYEAEPLSAEKIEEINNAIGIFGTLYPDSKLNYRFSKKAKGRFSVKSPQFLIISGSGKNGEKEAAGFLFQKLVLFLDSIELGSVWLGSTKDVESNDTSNDIITLALGTPAENIHRLESEFTRVPIDKITNAVEDKCIQAAHLAPSAVNVQPWYFEKKNDVVFVYQKKLRPPLAFIYRFADFDTGVALSHYAIACENFGIPFNFTRTEEIPNKTGYLPFGRIE